MSEEPQGSLLDALRAMHEQQAALAAAVSEVVERCRKEHSSGDTDADAAAAAAAATATTAASQAQSKSAKADPSGASEDVDMPDVAQDGSEGPGGDAPLKKAKTKKTKSTSTSTTTTRTVAEVAAGGFVCRACFDALLALVRDTYAAPAAAWYAGEQAALDAVLEDVRGLRAPLARIDALLADRKRAWLRARLQDGTSLALATRDGDDETESGAAAPETEATTTAAATKLSDPDADVAAVLRSLLADQPASAAAAAAEAVQRLKAAPTPSAQGAVLCDVLFSPTTGTAPSVAPATTPADAAAVGGPPAVRALAQQLRAAGAAALHKKSVQTAQRALRATGDDAAGRTAAVEKHRRRLAELRRAKAAHEAQKRQRMKPVEVPYFLQGESPCATCGRATDPQRSPLCLVCFLEADSCLHQGPGGGGSGSDNNDNNNDSGSGNGSDSDNSHPTAWCSRRCMAQTYSRHMTTAHPCAADTRCVRHAAATTTTTTTATADRHEHSAFCRECVLAFGVGTLYCGARCASRDFQFHRETVHLPKRELRADLHDDQADLAYGAAPAAPDAAYTAADIAKHLLPVAEAFTGCQRKHPDWALTETKVQVMVP